MTVQHTMSAEDLQAWEREHSVRRCLKCGTPITRHSTTGKCGACVKKNTCTRCGNPARAGAEYCKRCQLHHDLPGKARASRPTTAQRVWFNATAELMSTTKHARPLEGRCVHRWLVPELPTGPDSHAYLQRCRLCGAEKEVRPWAAEDAVREKVTQRMRA